MASKQTEALNALYRGWTAALQANPEMPLEEMRLMLEQWGNITGEPRGVDYIETAAGEVPALWAAPKNCAEDRVLLCAHGGGYVAASMYTHRKTYGHVAKTIGCRALIVDYRRAPENVHPGPVHDMAQSYKWLLDQGIRPGHVAFIGDSAGGALAVTTILRARQQGLPLPAATMPLSPWLDMEATGATFETNAQKDLIVSRDRRRSCRAAKRSPRTRLCKNRVRNRLSAGGRWIRTSGSACDASPA
jgi:epsilon-lactone hydrolase